jgi:hypothetical protein
MIIYQIAIFDQIPEFVSQCMNTVSVFAKKNNCEYRIIDTMPDWANHPHDTNKRAEYLYRRYVSEYLRLYCLAQEPETMVIDTDIELFDNFAIQIPGVPAVSKEQPESMVYNGYNAEPFEKALSLFDREKYTPKEPVMLNCLHYALHPFNYFDTNTFYHYRGYNIFVTGDMMTNKRYFDIIKNNIPTVKASKNILR